MKVSSFLESFRTLPKVFWLLCLTTTLFYSASHLFTTMLPIHLNGIHVSPAESGKLLALFLVASVLVRPWVGKLYEEWPPRRLFLVSMAFFGTGTILMLCPIHCGCYGSLEPCKAWVFRFSHVACCASTK